MIIAISIAFVVFILWPRLMAVLRRLRRSKTLLDPEPYERLAAEIFEFLEQRADQDLDRGVHPLADIPEDADPQLRKRLVQEHEDRVAAYSAETAHLFNRRFGVRAEYLLGLARAAGYVTARDEETPANRLTDPAAIPKIMQTLKFVAQMIGRTPEMVTQRAR